MKQTFKAKLQARGPNGAWIHLPIPFDVNAVFGSKARVAVAGTINGVAFRNSLMPEGGGTHYMMVNKDLRTAAKVMAGDTVVVTMETDEKERRVTKPEDFAKALSKKKKASSLFATLSYSQQKEYVDWILGAKQDVTRANRIEKAVQMLADGQKRLR